MATVNVSTNSQLLSALKSTSSGDVINLANGHYSLSLNSFSKAVTITSAGSAVFDHLELVKSSHLKIDGVDFNAPNGVEKPFIVRLSSDITIRNGDMEGVASGYGEGKGIWVNQTSGFTFENMNLHGFSMGAFLAGIDDLTFRNNILSEIKWDGMMVGGIHHGLFEGNHISLHRPAGLQHTDGMQFYNSGSNNPLSDVTIRDNVIETHNNASHGIYMANGIASAGGGTSSYFRNLLIEDNTVVSGQVSGIAVGQTSGLTVRDNTILQDTHFSSTKEISIPVIRVHANSTGVSITGNTTHRQPEPSGNNWFPTDKPEPTWTIANNKIVPLGTTPSAAQTASAQPLSGDADIFRLDTSAPGAFDARAGANTREISVHGNSVAIDHLAELHELDTASGALHLPEAGNETTLLEIEQLGGGHIVQLGLAHECIA